MSENTASVLIVDDEADACANLRDILTDPRYRADTASNGQEAIEFVGRSAYDVTLFDLKMPGMDGITAYRKTMATVSGQWFRYILKPKARICRNSSGRSWPQGTRS